ncbi:MAG TPA: GNAT family N-acetyltransferase [Acholeplasmataceae bacterium]|nr:GNAT family N-acetyltransferase [Acholeplasmataceae bacterium]
MNYMHILPIHTKDVKGLTSLFNKQTSSDEFLYQNLNEDAFKLKFMNSNKAYNIYTFVAKSDNQALGFISGVYDKTTKKAYITIIIVDEKHRRKGIGSKLLKVLEYTLLKEALEQRKIEIVFFNPLNLSWHIPNTNALHPNAPGIDKLSNAYLFFKEHGYIDFAVQNVYYMEIKNYLYSAETLKVLNKVEQAGFKIDYYDVENDYGLEALLDHLGSLVWKNEVLNHIKQKGKENTLLVPTLDNKVLGFTGPLRLEDSGRGYFAGIGTHADVRGKGIGKALFARLIHGLKDIGASYMTLFTGENNPARRLYEKEGFEIVRTYINLRKVDF